MSIQIEIPDELLVAIKLPLPELKKGFSKELAFAFYSRWALSIGKARQLAGLTKREFLKEIAARGLGRHYSFKDSSADKDYLSFPSKPA